MADSDNGMIGQSVINAHLMVVDETGKWVPLKSTEGGLSTNPTAGSAITSVIGQDGVTASVSGQILTVELTDMAQSRIKGRAESAGTGAPTDLTPTQVMAILDAEDVTWTGKHSWNKELNLLEAAAPANSAAPGYGQLYINNTDHELHINSNSVERTILTQTSAASRLIGRGSASGAGALQEISIGTMLSMSGTTLNAAIANNSVSDAMLRQGGAQTVIGRSANSTGNVADIALTAGKFLGSRGSSLGANYVSKVMYQTSSTLTLAADDNNATVICNTVSNGITITLPQISTVGDHTRYRVYKTSASNTVTINRSSSDVFGPRANTSEILYGQNAYVDIISDSANSTWWVVDSNDWKHARVTTASNFTSNTQYFDMTSMDLSPGEWDLSGIVYVLLNGSNLSEYRAVLSAFSGNTATDHQAGDNFVWSNPPVAAYDKSVAIPSWRVSVASTTTYYIKIAGTYSSGTPQYECRVSARRYG